MENELNNILSIISKEMIDYYIVGSTALMLHGIEVSPKDIDIVIKDSNQLLIFNDFQNKDRISDSVYKCKRECITTNKEIVIDIFEFDFPDSIEIVEINGIKVISLECIKCSEELILKDYEEKFCKFYEKLNSNIEIINKHILNKKATI
jgi:hypothetical protein